MNFRAVRMPEMFVKLIRLYSIQFCNTVQTRPFAQYYMYRSHKKDFTIFTLVLQLLARAYE